MNRRHFLAATALPLFAQHHDAPAQPSADEVLRDLKTGNARFAAGRPTRPHASLDRVHEVAGAQRPRAVVLSCADSRVPPEVLFDQGIGDIFVVRVAGNVANNDEIASAEYAIEHFGSPLLVVLGHSQCGAVTAVVNRDPAPKDLAKLVAHIAEAVEKVRRAQPAVSGAALVEASVKQNVIETIGDLQAGGEIIRTHVRAGTLRIAGGVYALADGKVAWV